MLGLAQAGVRVIDDDRARGLDRGGPADAAVHAEYRLAVEEPLEHVDQDRPAARVSHVPRVGRDRDAETLGLCNHLLDEIVIGYQVHSWARALRERALRDQQPDDRLPAARVHLDDEVSGGPPLPPLVQNLILRAPEIVHPARFVRQGIENVPWVHRLLAARPLVKRAEIDTHLPVRPL